MISICICECVIAPHLPQSPACQQPSMQICHSAAISGGCLFVSPSSKVQFSIAYLSHFCIFGFLLSHFHHSDLCLLFIPPPFVTLLSQSKRHLSVVYLSTFCRINEIFVSLEGQNVKVVRASKLDSISVSLFVKMILDILKMILIYLIQEIY